MKITTFAVVLAVVALALASATNPCQAGSVTYDFVEGTGAPHPGTTGATITVASPPASSTSPWSTTTASDILGVNIIDSALFPVNFNDAFFNIVLFIPLGSTGVSIQDGIIANGNAYQEFSIGTTGTVFTSGPYSQEIYGVWLTAASVPEPASAVLAGIASAIGLALAAFRKRKEARRQRPVGPLDANQ